ncbi:hypothetical protein [Conexibacter sp. SYSU D00693]|uniref:hypothetical protein n=1 Tax=Conexibacter sp. SYSU D00693 TaxID=2812560 RepID=UPI00196B8DAC|nr:hypothetical protein [Conexibacter sp. SYSU D00693]
MVPGPRAVSLVVVIFATLLALAPPAGAQTTSAKELRLSRVDVDRSGELQQPGSSWTVAEASAAFDAPDRFRSEYAWRVPATVPAEGARASLDVTAIGRAEASAASAQLSGTAIVEPSRGEGRLAISADEGQTTTDHLDARLTPSAQEGEQTIVIRILDGPTITFVYRVVASTAPAVDPAAAAACPARLFPRPPRGCAALIEIVSRQREPIAGKTVAYVAPSPGAMARYPGPKLGKEAREATVELTFVNATSIVQEPPPVMAVQPRLRVQPEVCEVGLAGPAGWLLDDLQTLRTELDAFTTCTDALTNTVRIGDELRALREGVEPDPARSLQPACIGVTMRVGGVRSRLQIACTPTATGVRLRVRARPPIRTLRGALRDRPLELLLGRSALRTTPASGDRVNTFWQLRRTLSD